MNNIKEVIIIGGGYSIQEGIELGLKSKIQNKCIITLNYAIKHFPSTLECFVDKTFYSDKKIDLIKLHLICGKYHNIIPYHPNTLALKVTTVFDITLQKGVYRSILVGFFALTLALYLFPESNIYLLGYDHNFKQDNNDITTHYYQSDKTLKHRGIKKISYYNSHKKCKGWDVYLPYKDKIFNVSLSSQIYQFTKIDYNQFFSSLSKFIYK